MKDKMYNMDSIIKNHKIEPVVMSLEPWLWIKKFRRTNTMILNSPKCADASASGSL